MFAYSISLLQSISLILVIISLQASCDFPCFLLELSLFSIMLTLRRIVVRFTLWCLSVGCSDVFLMIRLGRRSQRLSDISIPYRVWNEHPITCLVTADVYPDYLSEVIGLLLSFSIFSHFLFVRRYFAHSAHRSGDFSSTISEQSSNWFLPWTNLPYLSPTYVFVCLCQCGLWNMYFIFSL